MRSLARGNSSLTPPRMQKFLGSSFGYTKRKRKRKHYCEVLGYAGETHWNSGKPHVHTSYSTQERRSQVHSFDRVAKVKCSKLSRLHSPSRQRLDYVILAILTANNFTTDSQQRLFLPTIQRTTSITFHLVRTSCFTDRPSRRPNAPQRSFSGAAQFCCQLSRS